VLREWDATTPVPDDLVGKFDIINIRLLGFVIRDDPGPSPVLRNLISMLSRWNYTSLDLLAIYSQLTYPLRHRAWRLFAMVRSRRGVVAH
jgi:hypothetical protein